MADSLVIVAVPDENDRVWKVSSEKIPHLTLLYLGEDVSQVDNVDQIVGFVEHAANRMLGRFYLPVDRRGELGDDKADVLFFKQNRYDAKAVRDFRAALLQDPNIKKAYDATTQFDGPWKPHLTLGYPETPAKPDQDDMAFYDVSFTKIAVWLGDYKGQEFLLKDHWDEVDDAMGAVPMDVAMSDIQHYGVKGMKWGVRKAREGGAAVAGPADSRRRRVGGGVKTAAKDFWFETEWGHDNMQGRAIRDASLKYSAQDLPRLNAQYKGTNAATTKGRLKNPLDPKTIEYRSRARAAYRDRLNEAVDALPTNASGTRRYAIEDDGATNANYVWRLKTVAVKKQSGLEKIEHADTDTELVDFVVRPVFDEDGFIVDIKPVQETNSMQQTVDLGADFLEHYGVKGMRWGVRKAQFHETRARSLSERADRIQKAMPTRDAKTQELMREEHKLTVAAAKDHATKAAEARRGPQPVEPKATSKVPAGTFRKTQIKTEGGENHDAHEDAIKVARAQTKLKKSGPAALSNQELRMLQERLNLERNATQLVRDTGRIGKGRKFVRTVTGVNQEVNNTVGTGLQSRTLYDQARRPRR